MPVTLSPRGDILEIRDWWQNAPSSNAIIAAQAGQQSFDRPVSSLSTATQIPLSLAIKYYEPERDFQSGIQRSERSGVGRNTAQIELPAAMSAPGAKRLVDLQLLQMQRGRETWSGHIVLGEKALHVGDWLVDDSNPNRWRITEIEHLRGVSRVSAMRSIDSNSSQNLDTNPGRNVTSPDISAGETRIIAIDLPVIDTNDRGKPLVAIATAGTERGWRQAALSLQQGDMLLELGATSGPSVMGSAVTALGDHSPYYTDNRSILDIDLLHEGIEISPVTGLIWLNGELLRYGQALYMGNKRYRLTQLQRGCYGSEDRTAQHQAGDRFLFLDPDTLRILDDVSLSINQQLTIEAFGIGDAAPVLTTLAVSGHATLPFAPVHAASGITADNGIELNWVRRSRIDYGWNDGVDQPLVEESEAYAIEAFRNSVLIANWNSNEPRLVLPSSQIADLQLSAGAVVTFSIRQIGRYGQSAPAELTVTIH
jgi:Putative phage tail protein